MKNKNFGLTSSDCDPIKKYKGNISDNNMFIGKVIYMISRIQAYLIK